MPSLRQHIDAVSDPYLRGRCMVLALAIHERIGGEIVGIYDDIWDNMPRHLGVLLPNGLYADSRGLSLSEEDFLKGFVDVRAKYDRDDWTCDDALRLGISNETSQSLPSSS